MTTTTTHQIECAKEFESPAYVLDLQDSFNRATIESAAPNKELKVLARPENDSSARAIVANGKLSHDGTVFSVIVQTDSGQQSHEWTWSALQDALGSYRT